MENNEQKTNNRRIESRFMKMVEKNPVKTFENTVAKKSNLVSSLILSDELKELFMKTYANVLFYYGKENLHFGSIFDIFQFYWKIQHHQISNYSNVILYPNLGIDDDYKLKNGSWLIGPANDKETFRKLYGDEGYSFAADRVIEQVERESLNVFSKVGECQQNGILPIPITITSGRFLFYDHSNFWIPFIVKIIDVLNKKHTSVYQLVYNSSIIDVNKRGTCNPRLTDVKRITIKL